MQACRFYFLLVAVKWMGLRNDAMNYGHIPIRNCLHHVVLANKIYKLEINNKIFYYNDSKVQMVWICFHRWCDIRNVTQPSVTYALWYPWRPPSTQQSGPWMNLAQDMHCIQMVTHGRADLSEGSGVFQMCMKFTFMIGLSNYSIEPPYHFLLLTLSD